MEKRWIALILVLIALAGTAHAETTEAWILCQPDSMVNVRSSPRKTAIVEGWLFAGDMIEVDRWTKDWVHIVNASCEAGEGWVASGYVTEYFAQVMDGEPWRTNHRQVNTRYCIGGKRRNVLTKGTELEVYVMAQDWSVTSKGFIRTEYLEEVIDNE